MHLLENSIKDYSQWFEGRKNQVADALSRDNDRSDEELTNILRSHVPSQMPEHFKIVPLPNEIVSWLTSLLLKLPVKKQLQEKHKLTKLGRGADGNLTATPSDSRTSTWTSSPEEDASDSWEPLLWLSVKGDFQDQLMIP